MVKQCDIIRTMMAWSPDGSRLLVAGESIHSFVLALATGGQVTHSASQQPAKPCAMPACWSLDGRRLYFADDEGGTWIDVDAWLAGRTDASRMSKIAASQQRLTGGMFSPDLLACLVLMDDVSLRLVQM